MNMEYLRVAINLPVKNLFRQFLYVRPPHLAQLDIGWRVVVPFGAQKAEGFVCGVLSEKEAREEFEAEAPGKRWNPDKIRAAECAVGASPWFDAEMLQTSAWLADYYMCSLAEAMRLFIPGKSSIKRHAVYGNDGRLLAYEYEERLKEKTRLAYRITPSGAAALAEGNPRLKAQMAALAFLRGRDEKKLDAATVADAAAEKIGAATLKILADKGWAERGRLRVLRNSYARNERRTEELVLTGEQKSTLTELTEALDADAVKEFLLQGVTGSGKTEVYLRAAEYALRRGRQVLVLVPEIALTAQIVKRFQSWFKDEVAVAHSKLSQNERGDVWYKLRTGEANILIGVRSAVFAPFKNLGLVIIDEEHETSYKQEERPGYHARETARERCTLVGAVLLLGSATPALETYYRAITGAIRHLRLTERPTGAQLPPVTVVDMRAELAAHNYGVLSRELRRCLLGAVHAGQQAIVLLNRRGYDTSVVCRDCGETIMCPHCSVSLVYHKVGNILRCHYCGNDYPLPPACPSCGSKRIRYLGTGTQRAEEEIAALSGVRVLRMDQDSTRRKMAHEEIIEGFASGSANVLIGTQMVAKGHDIANVTLVGILAADGVLNLPDFRAGERCFDLLTQAAGRAGRASLPGRVVLQTYNPENRVIELAARQDYDTFAREELRMREELCYPPFGGVLKITVWDKSEAKSAATAGELAEFLKRTVMNNGLTGTQVMGPFAPMTPKVRDLYRTQLVVKGRDLELVKEALMRSPHRAAKNIYFDVDPLNML